MRERMKQGKKILICFALCMVAGLGFWYQADVSVQAEEYSFNIEATKLPTNEETYNIQLSIENEGEDWDGIVRLTVNEEYNYPTAYDTVISLPEGSTKQFVVKVPLNSIEDTNGNILVVLYNKKQEEVASEEFYQLLKEEDDYLTMGILSDDYAALTYLDMGGQQVYFYRDDYPVKLTEVTQGNLENTLEALEFLVIDTYNTDVLTDEELLLIEKWNYDGGILIVGTGAYGENTLAGFEDGYLGIECTKITEPDNTIIYYDQDYVSMDMLALAQLQETSNVFYNVQYMNQAWTCSFGDGAVGILPYSLTELGTMGDDFYHYVDQKAFVADIIDTISMESQTRHQNSTYNSNYNNANMVRRALRIIGSVNSPLNFGVLKTLVICYVIFVGPVLYVILRMAKKRELYWVAVPGAALLGILLIFFAGRGFEVVDTRVYSVTTENMKADRDASSYLYCYDASNKEWELQLSDGYQYASAFFNEERCYDNNIFSLINYYHHIQKEGDSIAFGIRPSSNFEDSFFYAGGKESTTDGKVDFWGINFEAHDIEGTIVNTTDKDFTYFAVIHNGILHVFKGLEAGESYELKLGNSLFNTDQGNDVVHEYVYYFLNDIRDEEEPETVSALAALGIGIFSTYKEADVGKTVVLGVVENSDNTVNDDCSEMAFSCLYVVE